MTTASLSISEMEKLIEQRRTQVLDLCKRRDQLVKELDSVNSEINAIAGGVTVRSRGRKRRRVKNEQSLRTVVCEILGKSKKGFTLADLSTKVLDSGYKSGSKNFRNVLYQCLYNTEGVIHDQASGCYSIAR